MATLNKHFSHIRIANTSDKVYKDECIYSFDTPEFEHGLYICLKTFEAVGEDFLDYYYARYGHTVYLHHKRLKYKINKPESSDAKPKRLAIGLEGGFDPDASEKEYRFEDTYSVIIMPDRTHISLPNPDLPELLLQSIESIKSSQSSETREASVRDTWDGEQRRVSQHADQLQQLTPAPTIPTSNWKCQQCDKTENLWLNLTDGSILCGRRFYDGSGGNNHAVEHYEKTMYPLAVKLGTITAKGADVYSYPEEDMVIDPHLDKHLAHFGIDIHKMVKTEKSILELEIDMNKKLGEWQVIQEEGKNLEPATGPGFTGLANLGNSCYMNSVLQVLFSINEFQRRYYPPHSVYDNCHGFVSFDHQMAKLAYGLLSGKYSSIDPATNSQRGIKPKTFKHFVCGNDQNFSTKRQQDAHEFFLFLMDLVEMSDSNSRQTQETKSDDKVPVTDPTKCLEFVVEDRIQCSQSKKVRYNQRVESCLSLHIDVDLALNKNDVDEYQARKAASDATSSAKENSDIVRPRIPLQSCIELFAKPETLSDFYSAAISAHTTAEKTSKISKFPRVFVFQMKKFQCGPDLVAKKLDVAIEAPDILDLEFLYGKGQQPGEEKLEDSDEVAQPVAAGSWDCSTGENSTGGASTCDGAKPSIEPDSEAVATLLSMGIDMTDAITALKLCNNDAQRAIEYIFDPDSFNPAPASDAIGPKPKMNVVSRSDPLKVKIYASDDRPKLYQLKAFISHMGTSTMCGHYVCHIRKDDRWYIYNDEKVAVSEKPPTEFGYLYFYERMAE